MSLKQRLERLEALELEHWIADRISEEAKRMAKESGRDVEDIAAEMRDSADRILRYGMEAEIRLLAQELGKTEEEVRVELAALPQQEPEP